MSELMLDVDQAGELKAAFRRGDWTNSEIKQLSEGDILVRVRGVLRGLAEIKPFEYVIDLDSDPFLPNDWVVEKHQKGGAVKLERKGDDLYLNGKKINFFLSKSQLKGGCVNGNELRKELAEMPVLNANVLDYLLKNPHLIPESWKKDANGNTRYIFFWGTVYRHSDRGLYVRYLYWDGGRWHWDYDWLGGDWGGNNPTAVSAS